MSAIQIALTKIPILVGISTNMFECLHLRTPAYVQCGQGYDRCTDPVELRVSAFGSMIFVLRTRCLVENGDGSDAQCILVRAEASIRFYPTTRVTLHEKNVALRVLFA